MFRRGIWLLVAVLLSLPIAVPLAPTARSQAEPPQVSAQSFVVLSDFNEVLYAQNEHQRLPPASLTKMMTAIVAVRYGNLGTSVVIEPHDIIGEATMGLVEGQVFTLGELLYGLLMPSGNDAALTIARAVGWAPGDTTPEQSVQRFVGLMNQTARDLQLRNTHFMNPHGLDQWGHYSTAYDMALILRAALNHPEIRERMTTLAIRVGESTDLYSNNELLRSRDDYLGGKTGLTDGCGYCLAAAARQDQRMVIAVVMQDDWNWFWDVGMLLDYGFALSREQGIPPWADPSLLGTQLDQPRP